MSAECLLCQFDQDGTPHFAVNVIAPNQSAKRVAFGPVGSMNVVMMRRHPLDVLAGRGHNELDVNGTFKCVENELKCILQQLQRSVDGLTLCGPAGNCCRQCLAKVALLDAVLDLTRGMVKSFLTAAAASMWIHAYHAGYRLADRTLAPVGTF